MNFIVRPCSPKSLCGLVAEHRAWNLKVWGWILYGNWEFFFVTRKTSFSISLLSSKTYHLLYSIYKHDAINITDPCSMQDTCHIWTSKWALHSIESLWLSVRASECGIQRSQVQFLMRTQNFCFVSCLWKDEKHLSLSLYSAQKHKCTISLILFTKINLSTQWLSFSCRESSCKSCCSSESAVHGYWCDQGSGPAGLQAR